MYAGKEAGSLSGSNAGQYVKGNFPVLQERFIYLNLNYLSSSY